MILKFFHRKTSVILQAILCICAGSTFAQHVSQEEVRDFIAKGDVSGIETALAAQKRAVANGAVTQDAQRETFLAFSTTDPQMHSFVRDWVEQKPNSIYALTAHTWMEYNIAGLLRGDENGRDTYPEAMLGFRHLMAGALEKALKANTLDRGFVPASDAILRIGTYADLPRPLEDYLAEIMEISPNYGSLYRGFSSTNPGWGGSWAAAEYMCDTYAEKIVKFENYTPRICKLDAAFAAVHHSNIRSGYIETTDDLQHPAIRSHRTRIALYYFNNLEETDKLARTQMTEAEFTDVQLAEEYDRFIAAPRGWPAQALSVYERAVKEAQEKLKHDPYNPRLLKVLLRMKVSGEQIPQPLSYEKRIDYLKRSLVFQPYNKDVWEDWHEMQYVRWDPNAPLAAEETLINSIVFSRHSPHRLKVAMDYYFRMAELQGRIAHLSNGMTTERAQELKNTKFGDLPQHTFICPFIRAHRVWKEVCAYDAENMQCYPRQIETAGYQSLTDYTKAEDMCLKERSSPMEDLYYMPLEIDIELPNG